MNADPEELLKFNRLAGKWWDTKGVFRTLHELNPLRLEWIEQFSPVKGKRILDIGCGGGILSEALTRQGASVTGVELADDALSAARAHAARSGLAIDYRLMSVENLADTESSAYDIVVCMEMLEHVPDPASVIRAASHLVKPEGTVYFSTLNRNPKSFICAIVGAEYVLGMLPRGTHQYARFVTPAELSAHARNAGLDVIAITGIRYNLFGETFRFTRDVRVNYMTACQRRF